MNNNRICWPGICLFIFTISASNIVLAQSPPQQSAASTNWKFWGAITVDLALSKESKITFGYLRSNDLNDSINTILSKNVFNQFGTSFEYAFSDHLKTRAGILISQFPSSGNFLMRYFVKADYKINIGEKVKWTNGLVVEKHSSNENRFSYRFIYITQLGLRKRLDFLSLSPSVSYWLFYNVGGTKIQYYDDLGQPSELETPDGIHRGRLVLKLNSKISDMLDISVYYMKQTEFNLFNDYRSLNVVNPSTGKISRPFNNYNVIGVTINTNFDL